MNSYQAIIFDLGNVVINISFDKMFDYWAKVNGCDVVDIKRNLRLMKCTVNLKEEKFHLVPIEGMSWKHWDFI